MTKRVATVLLVFGDEKEGRLLVLKRSQQVHTCKGLWACVSGSVERDETPLECATRELCEETTLSAATLVRPGRPFRVSVPRGGVVEVHPFLFRASSAAEHATTIDFEHTEFRVLPAGSDPVTELLRFETVPRLAETYARADLDPESAAAVASIAENRTDGAAEVAKAAVRGFAGCVRRTTAGRAAVFKDFAQCVQSLAWHFAKARLSMCSVATAVCRVVANAIAKTSVADTTWSQVQDAVSNAAESMIAGLCEAGDFIARNWLATLPTQNLAVVTLSRSGTVANALRQCSTACSLYIAESRMACEGVDLARTLPSAIVFPDCAAASLLSTLVQQGKSVVVVVGADQIFGNMAFVNKAGTRHLSLITRELGIRFCVLADTSKIRPEQTPPIEFPFSVAELETATTSFKGPASWAPVFELIPESSLPPKIEFFTELGITSPARIAELSAANAALISTFLGPSD